MQDFSLIILCQRQTYLLPLTLDTLKPQKGSFEVLLLGDTKGDFAKRYPELHLRSSKASGTTLGEMMNEAIQLARGKYIQFLEPGDRYISQQGLEYLHTLMNDEPHLIYANSLFKGGILYANPINARSCWFLKSKLLELGGFDSHLTYPTMDILCRFNRDQKTKSVFCKRIIIDSAFPEKIFIAEMWKVLYRHFGFRHALKWIFFHDHSRFLSRALSFLKNAFWHEDQ